MLQFVLWTEDETSVVSESKTLVLLRERAVSQKQQLPDTSDVNINQATYLWPKGYGNDFNHYLVFQKNFQIH